MKSTIASLLAAALVTHLIPASADSSSSGSFEQIAPDGSNLRQTLVDSPLIREVIPFGPNYTLVVPKLKGGGLFVASMADEFIAEIPKLCRTQWQHKVVNVDLMSGKTTLNWAALDLSQDPRLALRSTLRNPETKAISETRGSSCKGAFEITSYFTVGGVNNLPYSFVVRHEVAQPKIAKSPTFVMPTEDLKVADGVMPGTLVEQRGYPLSSTVAAWGLALCEYRGGVARFYTQSLKVPITDPGAMAAFDVPTRYTKNAPLQPFFVECSGPAAFLIKGDEFDMKLRLVFQSNRTLESLGIR